MTFFEINCNTIQTALTQNLKVLKMAKCLFVCFQSQVYVNNFLDGNFHISQDMWWSRIGFIISIGANQNRNPRPRRPKQLLHHPLSLLSSRGLTVNSSSSLDVSLWSTKKPLAKNCFWKTLALKTNFNRNVSFITISLLPLCFAAFSQRS